MSSLPTEDAERGKYPMAEGLLDYFPNALAEVSRISYEGNLKHNPGQPMHWNRGKSLDHRNKIVRHTVDSVTDDEPGIEHAAQAAWRALAHLQQKIETVRGVPMPANARLDKPVGGSAIKLRRLVPHSDLLTVGKIYTAIPDGAGHYVTLADQGQDWRISEQVIDDGVLWEKVDG